jgi:hypothetical protein
MLPDLEVERIVFLLAKIAPDRRARVLLKKSVRTR